MDWISPEKNRHGPNKQTTHQHGHQTRFLSLFLLSFILTNMDTRPDFYHFFLLSFILNIMDTRRQIYYYFYQARALRALGLLLADGTPTVGGGKTF